MTKNHILYPAIVFNIPNGISYRLIHFGQSMDDFSRCPFVPDELGYQQFAYSFWSGIMIYVTYMLVPADKTINEKFLGALFELTATSTADRNLSEREKTYWPLTYFTRTLHIYDPSTKILVWKIIESLLIDISTRKDLKENFRKELNKLQGVKLGRKTYFIFEELKYTWIGRTNWKTDL